MRRLCLKIRFLGTRYHGWQSQTNAPAVQDVLKEALLSLTAGDARGLTGCGRTDSGVHANAYYCHFDTGSSLPEERFVAGLNSKLPADIAVLSCREVPGDFHARYSATGKRYVYLIYSSPVRDPFLEGRAYRVNRELDVDLLNREAAAFAGEHDFSAFMASGSSVKSTRRVIGECRFTEHGRFTVFSVTGNGFLYNMVRIMVGTLLDTERGRFSPGQVERALLSGRRDDAGRTAPAHALYLDEVFYGKEGPGLAQTET